MSGIAAFAATVSSPAEGAWLDDATGHLAFAGPDAQECWCDEHAGLAHALLRTTDAPPTAQPTTLDGVVWLTADIRLDGRRDVVRDLRASGRAVGADATDAELLLHAYGAWGESCLDHLAGDFAFALWDARERRLLCACDQLGVVPLYYAPLGDRVLVSNVIDALLLHPAVAGTLDDGAIADFLLTGVAMDPDATTFAGIRRVPAGHALTWRAGRLAVRRYWQLPEWRGFARFASREEYGARFRDLLTEAVADRLDGSRLGVQLSGGLDSTSVAVIAHRLLREAQRPFALRAHTIVLDALMPDQEGEYARMVAESLGIDTDRIDAAACPDLDPMERPDLLPPEPAPYRRTALEYEFVRCPARHVRTVLSGLGADPLLCAAPSHALDWATRGEFARAWGAVREQMRFERALPAFRVRDTWRQWRARSAAPALPAWVDATFAAAIDLPARNRGRIQMLGADAVGAEALARSPFWPALLSCGDPGFTRVPIRFRYPFLDLRLVAYARSLPPVPWLERKRVLREAMRGLLPEPVRQRPKTVLAQPPAQAYAIHRGAAVRLDALIATAPELDRYIDRERLRTRAAAMAQGDGLTHRPLAAALGLAYWLHHWHRPVRPAHSAAPRRALAERRVGAAS